MWNQHCFPCKTPGGTVTRSGFGKTWWIFAKPRGFLLELWQIWWNFAKPGEILPKPDEFWNPRQFCPMGGQSDSNTILEIDYTDISIANDKTLQQITNKVIQLKCRYHATKDKLKYLDWRNTHEMTPQQCQPKIYLSTTDHLGTNHLRVIRQILEHTGKQVLSTHISQYNRAVFLTLFQIDELLDMISRSTTRKLGNSSYHSLIAKHYHN